MIQVRHWLPERSIVVVADSSFAALELLNAALELPVPIHLVTRLRLDAALYQPAPLRLPKQTGRPREVGKRLPTLKTLLADATTAWQSVTMECWYCGRDYTVELTAQTAVWYHTGLPPMPIRWVLVKARKADLSRKRFYALISVPPLSKFCIGFANVGRWKSPLRKPVLI